MKQLTDEIKELRRVLHGCPELALKEYKTKEILINYLRSNTALRVEDRGAWFYAVWGADGSRYGADSGRHEVEAVPIAFRADFDAVAGKDGKPGHYCGHDGHAAVLAGFGRLLSEEKPEKEVYLIFQPAEKIGRGAVLCSPLLKEKRITEIYGFHNIPGYRRGAVLLRRGTFACASTGLEIRICGTPSHAAYPEAGKNPAFALSRLVTELPELLAQPHRGVRLATVIGMEAGSDSYGVSASEGTLRLTVRGEYENEFEELVDCISERARAYAKEEGMQCRIREIERFPATENDTGCAARVEQAAERAGLSVLYPEEPLRWSEDFGYYLRETKGTFFGVGDGETHPQLHTEQFEFPDEIIGDVLRLYRELCRC
ncbi:MAG: M20/M25/M40 family metallo-hydrolase [Lachnospiraceae bacterium]|nr:M20/M25/M40 family metallo-hydrolase [Lachnospiraceae bacterium]